MSRALVVRSATLAAVTALGLAGAGVRADGYPDCPTVFTALAGVATWYAADGTGACSYDASNDLMVTAVALPDWAGSAHCGQCLEVWGPSGHIVVRVVDQCPECPSGHLDLSYQAFDAIADPNTGVIPIAFRSIECPVAGNLALRQKEGSNVWWFAVQPRDTRYPTVSVELRENASAVWQPMARQDYDYFLLTSGSGLQPPFDFRFTDLHGHVVEQDGLVQQVAPGETDVGTSQFPACAGLFLDGFESATLAPLWTSASP